MVPAIPNEIAKRNIQYAHMELSRRLPSCGEELVAAAVLAAVFSSVVM
jgi:hypothetical protein